MYTYHPSSNKTVRRSCNRQNNKEEILRVQNLVLNVSHCKLSICICTGKGIPNLLSQETMSAPVSQLCFPSHRQPQTAWYTNDLGMVLTGQACFGIDPFTSDSALEQCEAQFRREMPDLQLLSADNGDPQPPYRWLCCDWACNAVVVAQDHRTRLPGAGNSTDCRSLMRCEVCVNY